MKSFFNPFRKSKKKRPAKSQNRSTGSKEKKEDPAMPEKALAMYPTIPTPITGNLPPLSIVKECTVYAAGDLIAGQFQVTERLEGSMAYVYLANDRMQGISYAIKQPKQAMLAEPAFSRRIANAATAWTGLGMHPYIAYCYFVRYIKDVPHLFVEQVDGSNLCEWIDADKYDDLRLSLDWAIQVCHGMEKAHENDLIHGDLKPENILLSREGIVRITDFGLRSEGLRSQNGNDKSHDSESGISLDVITGTHAYMSPEQLLDPRQRAIGVPEGIWYDSDIYSFGVCLWEMIVQQLPYSMAPSVEQRPDPQDFRKDLPQSLVTLLRDVIAIDRSKRPQDFKALRESLNNIYRELFNTQAPSNTIELPKDNAAHDLNNRGCAYLEQKDIYHARNCFEQAIKMVPAHPQSTYNLTLIQWHSGQITDDKALSWLENCARDAALDRQVLDECMAQVEAERFNLNAAKTLLEGYPGRFDALFGHIDGRQARCLYTLEGHGGWINDVAMTTDGSRGLSGSDDKTVRLWNLETGECVRTLEGHTGRVSAVAINEDGRCGLSGSDDGAVRFWDLQTGECLHILEGHKSEVTSVALSADGCLALSGSNDKTVALWYVKTGECVHILAGHTGRVRSVALTPDGNIGLSGGNDKTLRFWNLITGQCISSTEENPSWIQSVALTADGKRGFSGNRDGSLSLWIQENKVCQHRLAGHSMSVESIALTADARWAVSASRRDTALSLWELKTGQTIQIMMGEQKHPLSLAITPDGQRILTGNNEKTVQLWELPLQNMYRAAFRIAPHRTLISEKNIDQMDQQRTTERKGIKETGAVEQKPAVEEAEPNAGMEDQEPVTEKKEIKASGVEDQLQATGSEGKGERVVDEKPATSLEECADTVPDRDVWIALHETWKNQEFSEDVSIIQQYSPLLVERRSSTLLKVKTLHRLDGDNGGFFALSQSGDGRWGLSGNADATLSFWDLETGENLRTLEGHEAIVSAVAMTSDGRFGLSASADATLRLWDLNCGECLRILGENTDPFTSVGMTPDGLWAITGQRLGFVETSLLLSLWDLTTGKLVHSWEGHREQVRSVALSSDSCWGLSGGADGALRLWNLKTFKNVHVLQGHTNVVNAVAMTPDHHWGLSGSHDTTLRLWDLQTGTCIRELEGHSAPVRSVAMTSDGRWGFSGDLDGSLRFWNLLTGECLKQLAWHTGYITSVALSSDGCLGLSASVDNTLVRWRFIWDLGLAPEKV